MRSFILGILLRVWFEGTVTAQAKEYVGKSPQSQRSDSCRKREQTVGVEQETTRLKNHFKGR